MDTTFTSYVIPIVYAIYGLFFLCKTPDYLNRSGLTTKQSRRSKEIWNWFHRAAGIYCLAAAVLTGVLAYLQVQMSDGVSLPPIFWIRMVIEIGTIAAVIPLVNALTRRKFPAGTETNEKK